MLIPPALLGNSGGHSHGGVVAAHVQADEEHKQQCVLGKLVRQNAKKTSTATAISHHIENLQNSWTTEAF